MKYDQFKNLLNQIRPNSDQAASIWLQWAEELEGYDSSNGELPEGSYKTAENFLDTFAEQLISIQERYGTEIAQQMISLAEISSCPFPWEMNRAAEHLAAGGELSEIAKMESEGTLEDSSPAMQM